MPALKRETARCAVHALRNYFERLRQPQPERVGETGRDAEPSRPAATPGFVGQRVEDLVTVRITKHDADDEESAIDEQRQAQACCRKRE